MTWEKVKLVDISSPKQWKTISTDMLTSDGYPVYGANGIIGKYKEYTHEIPTVLITCRGATCGNIHISQPFSYINGNAMALDKLSSKVSLRYLYYFLLSYDFSNVISGSAQPQITIQGLQKVEVPLPPLHMQEQIADTLDKADALRRKDQELLEKYDELAQSIFYDMFGDPVRNEKGWEIKKLGSLSNHISSGSTPLGGQKVYMRSGVLFIRSQNVLMRSFDISDAVFIDEATHKKMKRTWVKHNDVLLNITGASIGRIAVYEGEDDCANVNQHVCIIRPLKNVIDPYFLMFMMSTDIFQNNIIGKSAGGTRESFTFEQIKQFDIIVPPIELQTRYNEFVQKISNQLNLASECSVETGKTFQAIMSEYFS